MKPTLIWRALAGALLLAAQLAVAAATPAVAARIDGAPLLSFSVDAMWHQARAKEPALTRQATLERLIDNRLLAGAARRRYGEAALSSGARVGFAREVGFDDQLVALLRSQYGDQLAGGIDGMIRAQPRLDDAQLDAVFGKPGALVLEATLTAAQQERARAIVLLRYALPKGRERNITLLDVYQRQNVQGRVSMFARETAFMQQQARLEAWAVLVLETCGRRFGAEAVADLRRVLTEQADAQALLRMHGMGDDAHGGSALLDQLARGVSAARVNRYYRQHRDQFVRIERVRARHIRLPDEAAANSVAAALAGGADFAALARQYSVAPDGASGGALGWVRHTGAPEWLAQLLFAHADGQVSAPVRTPDAAWEIVLVEQREQGYQESGSESVRYAASRAIARELALSQLAALRKQLRRQAQIEIVRDAA
ncbi:MAG: peptidylprolyl isomerase [Pseudomonadota bacterium]